MKRAMGVYYMQCRVAFRNWWVYIAVSLLPASYYLVFYLIGGMALSGHVLYGSLVALTLNVGVVSLPQFLVLARNRRLQEMMVASPVRPLEYMFGFALSRLVFSLPGLGVILALLFAFGGLPVRSLPAILAVLMATWLVGSMIGFTLGTYVTSLSAVGSLANLAGFLLMLIPPVLYPATLLAGVWRTVALLLPSSSAAFLVRAAAGLQAATPGEILLTTAVLAAYLAGCAALVAVKSRWREV